MKRIITIVAGLLIALGAAAVPATAQTPSCDPGAVHSCFMLRAPYGLQQQIASNHALTILGEIQPGQPDLVFATGPANTLPETALANMKGDPDVIDVELVTLNMLSEQDAGSLTDTMPPTSPGDLTQTGIYVGPETVHFATTLWNGYAAQAALARIAVPAIHASPDEEAMGTGVIAVIDTGVDPNHPLLQGALVPGYDFILGQAGNASEWSALTDPVTTEANLTAAADQSHTAIVDGSGILDTTYSAMQPIVDQSHTAIVDTNGLPPGFGHGTMVAGILRVVAPGAKIMPLRVFDGNGVGDVGRIVEAVYYAVDNGAAIITMSFSTPEHVRELSRAIKYAKRRGVTCVSSAGNLGSYALTYPAAYGEVIGVGSTNPDDYLSTFSSRGSDLVTVGAPGEQIITAYPGGLYAAAWGTSFATAFVSGTAALLHDQNANSSTITTADFNQSESALVQGAYFSAPGNANQDLGFGRIDSYYTYECGPFNGDPATCLQAPK